MPRVNNHIQFIWKWKRERKKKEGSRSRMITYFVSCTSSLRRALMWIIKCKLPSVICHVAWRTRGVFHSEQMLLSTSPAKSFMWVTVSFAVVRARWPSSSDFAFQKKTKKKSLHLFAHFNSFLSVTLMRGPECCAVVQVPGTLWYLRYLTPQLFRDELRSR